jgi:hypothetical protein
MKTNPIKPFEKPKHPMQQRTKEWQELQNEKHEQMRKAHEKDTVNQYELARDGEVKFTGTEDECYYKLQRIQGFSAHWAIMYEGWTVTKTK